MFLPVGKYFPMECPYVPIHVPTGRDKLLGLSLVVVQYACASVHPHPHPFPQEQPSQSWYRWRCLCAAWLPTCRCGRWRQKDNRGVVQKLGDSVLSAVSNNKVMFAVGAGVLGLVAAWAHQTKQESFIGYWSHHNSTRGRG